MKERKDPERLFGRRSGREQPEKEVTSDNDAPEVKLDGNNHHAPDLPFSMATALERALGIHPREHPLYKAAMRCLRVLMDHAGLTPELVAKKTSRPLTEIEVVMDEPMLLADYLMLWDLSTEENEGHLDKCATTIRILLAHDEVDTEMIQFLGSIGHMYLVFGGEFLRTGILSSDA